MITSFANTSDFLFVKTSAAIIAHIIFWSSSAVTSDRLLFGITSETHPVHCSDEFIAVTIVPHSQHFGGVMWSTCT